VIYNNIVLEITVLSQNARKNIWRAGDILQIYEVFSERSIKVIERILRNWTICGKLPALIEKQK
jgi:hypothetical protein